MLILVIECENMEFIEYICTTRQPDISVSLYDGHSCMHVAAMVNFSGPLQSLIRYRRVQEHFDDALVLQGRPEHQAGRTRP
jgi:hypothetical protein